MSHRVLGTLLALVIPMSFIPTPVAGTGKHRQWRGSGSAPDAVGPSGPTGDLEQHDDDASRASR